MTDVPKWAVAGALWSASAKIRAANWCRWSQARPSPAWKYHYRINRGCTHMTHSLARHPDQHGRVLMCDRRQHQSPVCTTGYMILSFSPTPGKTINASLNKRSALMLMKDDQRLLSLSSSPSLHFFILVLFFLSQRDGEHIVGHGTEAKRVKDHSVI